MIINALPNDEDMVQFNKLTNQEKLHIAFSLLKEENTDKQTHVIKNYELNKKTINNTIYKYFGKNASVQMEDYLCPYCESHALYEYNKESEKFIETNTGHGYYSLINENIIVKTEQKDDEYFITVVKTFAAPDGDFIENYPTQLYQKAQDAYNKENAVANLDGTKYCVYDEDFAGVVCDYEKYAKDNLDLFLKYTYKFIIENKEIVFISYNIK